MRQVLHRLTEVHGLSQCEMARRCGLVQPMISRWLQATPRGALAAARLHVLLAELDAAAPPERDPHPRPPPVERTAAAGER